jgi:hypothetical protein
MYQVKTPLSGPLRGGASCCALRGGPWLSPANTRMGDRISFRHMFHNSCNCAEVMWYRSIVGVDPCVLPHKAIRMSVRERGVNSDKERGVLMMGDAAPEPSHGGGVHTDGHKSIRVGLKTVTLMLGTLRCHPACVTPRPLTSLF